MTTQPNKATIVVGYCKRGPLDDYRYWSRRNLLGADITATDGLGNTLQLNVREAPNGYRVELNGKVIATSTE